MSVVRQEPPPSSRGPSRPGHERERRNAGPRAGGRALIAAPPAPLRRWPPGFGVLPRSVPGWASRSTGTSA